MPIVLSSDPVIILKGLVGRKSQELMGFDWPAISPTEVPVSDMKTWPNLWKDQATNTRINFISRMRNCEWNQLDIY